MPWSSKHFDMLQRGESLNGFIKRSQVNNQKESRVKSCSPGMKQTGLLTPHLPLPKPASLLNAMVWTCVSLKFKAMVLRVKSTGWWWQDSCPHKTASGKVSPFSLSAFVLTCEDKAFVLSSKAPSWTERVSPHQPSNMPVPRSWTSNLQDYEKQIPVIYKLPTRCYFF